MVNTWALQRNERLINSNCDCASLKFAVSHRVIDKALFQKTVWTQLLCTTPTYPELLHSFCSDRQRSAPDFEVTHDVSLIVYPLSSLFCLNMHAVEECSCSQGSVTRDRESLDQNRTGLNWLMLREASASFPRLDVIRSVLKDGEGFKTFRAGSFNGAIKFHLRNVSEACQVSVGHPNFSSCYNIHLYITNEGGDHRRKSWLIDLCLICHKGGSFSFFLREYI